MSNAFIAGVARSDAVMSLSGNGREAPQKYRRRSVRFCVLGGPVPPSHAERTTRRLCNSFIASIWLAALPL